MLNYPRKSCLEEMSKVVIVDKKCIIILLFPNVRLKVRFYLLESENIE